MSELEASRFVFKTILKEDEILRFRSVDLEKCVLESNCFQESSLILSLFDSEL